MTRNKTYKILFLVAYWSLAVTFYVFIEMAIEDYTASTYKFYDLGYEYNFFSVLIIGLSVTIIAGFLLAHFEVLFFDKYFRKKPFGYVLLYKTFFYSLNIFIFTSAATYISLTFVLDKPFFHEAVNNRFAHFLSSPKMWAVMSYWGFVVMSSLFIVHISDKLGQGVLLNYILGRYHTPKEETRIFMFLDLTSSSIYAEKLGHITYSRLIQDCFFDLTSVVNKYDVQVYQYVGDEAVLTWRKDKGILNNNCIKTFFEFDSVLKSKCEYYENRYGLVPEFKAGIHFGYVTVAEVGEMKKELAFHGDAINTASHIRSVCGEYKKKLIISADLLSLLSNIDDNYKIESLGLRQFKGKKNLIGLFSVEDKKESTN